MQPFENRLPSSLALLWRLSRPIFLLGGILMYMLGAGVARYLGAPIDPLVLWLGQGIVTLLQLSTHFINEYFDVLTDADNPNRTPFSGGSGVAGISPRLTLTAIATTLTGTALLTVILASTGALGGPALFILLLGVIIAITYSAPPARLLSTGYGELVASIQVANLTPAFAFTLLYGEFHRLLAMLTLPLTFLHLAMLIAFSLPDYGSDMQHEKRTLLVRAGWQRGMLLHNLLLLGGYLVLAGAFLQGLPWQLGWPALLTLPLALFQIWRFNQIANGAVTRWTLLTFTALAIFGLAGYFLNLAVWTS